MNLDEIQYKLLQKGHTDLVIKLGASTKKEPHPGAMIAIMAPPKVRRLFSDFLSFQGASDPDSLHVTLSCLGKAEDLTAQQKTRIRDVCSRVASKHAPLRVKIGGFGRFITEDEGQVLYCSIDSVGLNELRADLVRETSMIVDVPVDHGFTPHLTLGFLRPGQAQNDPVLPEKLPSWKANNIRFVAAGDYSDHRFKLSQAYVKAALPEVPNVIRDKILDSLKGVIVSHARSLLQKMKKNSPNHRDDIDRVSRDIKKLAPKVRPKQQRDIKEVTVPVYESDLPDGTVLNENFVSGRKQGERYFELSVGLLTPSQSLMGDDKLKGLWWQDEGLIGLAWPKSLLQYFTNVNQLKLAPKAIHMILRKVDYTMRHEMIHMLQHITDEHYGMHGLSKDSDLREELTDRELYLLSPEEYKPQILSSVGDFIHYLDMLNNIDMSFSRETMERYLGTRGIVKQQGMNRPQTASFFATLKRHDQKRWKRAVRDFIYEFKRDPEAEPFLESLDLV